MSVDRTDYIFFGYKTLESKVKKHLKLEEDEYYEDLLDNFEDVSEFSVMYLTNKKEYILFGLKLNEKNGLYSGWNTNISIPDVDIEKIKQTYKKVFNIPDKENIDEPKLFIFSDFS